MSESVARSPGAAERLVPADLRRGRRLGGLLILLGVAIAVAGLVTFTPPTCTSPSPSARATCSPWENAQWLMIGGALLGVLGFLYLALVLRAERRQAASSDRSTTGADETESSA